MFAGVFVECTPIRDVIYNKIILSLVSAHVLFIQCIEKACENIFRLCHVVHTRMDSTETPT